MNRNNGYNKNALVYSLWPRSYLIAISASKPGVWINAL
jgi:hypothetical protein